jgi:hypothetical protein
MLPFGEFSVWETLRRGGDEKLKTEKLTIWQSIGAPEDGTLETGHLCSASVSRVAA